MKRQVVAVGIGACLIALAWGLTNSLLGPTAAVTEANFKRVQEGMTIEEVEALLGPPQMTGASSNAMATLPPNFWFTEDFVYTVSYDLEGQVLYTRRYSAKRFPLRPSLPQQKTPIERVRSWLGL
jgi:hypothetical protein